MGIAKMTVQTLDRCLPPAMPGVTFLSGGISEEDSSIYLNEINKLDRKGAFALTFSYSRALQSSCIKIWGGKDDKYKAAQEQLLARAQANSEASKGEYVPGSQPSIEESLFVKNYAYLVQALTVQAVVVHGPYWFGAGALREQTHER